MEREMEARRAYRYRPRESEIGRGRGRGEGGRVIDRSREVETLVVVSSVVC